MKRTMFILASLALLSLASCDPEESLDEHHGGPPQIGGSVGFAYEPHLWR